MTGVIIAGAAETDEIGRLPDHSTLQLHVEGALNAVADAGLSLRDIDGIATVSAPGPRAPDIAARLRGVAGLLICSCVPFSACRCVFLRGFAAKIDERFAAADWGGMMARMLTQVPLP